MVLGSQNLFVYLIDPKMVIIQASIFGYRFPVGLQQEQRAHFRMKPHPKTASGFGFAHVMGGIKIGNEWRTVLVLY